ncbi:MAG: hypothetical protein IJT16_02150 [Lachnospiraceae bacterium]|nr:hypothetical protein [Lachnospiraceae bacterium]MBQ9750266.1 hypothetical protein [Clostridia bacterium]
MNWKRVQGSIYPPEVDTTSSKKYNYVTKNVTEVQVEQEEGDPVILYEYDQLKINKEDWGLYLLTEKNAANIDYVAMMTDVELPEEE